MLFFAFTVQFIRLIYVDVGTDYISVLVSICIVVISTLIFFFYKEVYSEGQGQVFRISYIFILGFLIVHFQMYVDYLLGNYGNFRYDYFLSGENVNKAVIISSLGLLSFFIGYIFSIKQEILKYESVIAHGNSVNFLKFIAFLFFIAFFIMANKDYFHGGYGAVELSPIATHTQTFLIYAIIGVIALKSYEFKVSNKNFNVINYIKSIGYPFNVLVFIYLVLVLTSGDRGPVIQIGLCYMGGYVFTQNKKLKLISISILVFSSATFITLLGEVRALSEGATLEEIIEGVNYQSDLRESQSSFSPKTHELAISVRTVHAAIDYVDENGLKYGLIQLNQLMAIIPGFGRIVRGVFELDGSQLLSADIITLQLDATHGMGTSTVTDLYIDLAVPGVIVGLFFFGVILRRVDIATFLPYTTSFFFWLIVFVLLSKSIYIGRSSIMILLREVLTIYFLIFVGCIGKRR